MGRLIDADKCPCILCEDTRNAHCTYEHRSCEKFCNWLNNTAYDVEKVVAELEKIEEHCIYMFDFQGQSAIDNAIDIVKRGGAE